MDEKTIEMVMKERASNNNELSEFEKDVIKFNIDRKYIKGCTEIVFYTHNALSVEGYPTTINEVLEYCKNYQPGFYTIIAEIEKYAHKTRKFMKKFNAQKLQEYYERIRTTEEGLKVITRERALSPGLSGFEKLLINRILQTNFRYSYNEDDMILGIFYTFQKDQFPTTREEIEIYVHKYKTKKMINNSIVWLLSISIISFCLFLFI